MAFQSGRRFEFSKYDSGEEIYPGVDAYIKANPHKPLECAAAYFGVEQNPEITFSLPYKEIPGHYEKIGQFIMADMSGLPRPTYLSPAKVELVTRSEEKVPARVETPKPAPTRERRQTSNRKARQENPYIKHVAAPQPEYQANIIFPDPILIPLGDYFFPNNEVDSVAEQQAAEAFVAQVLGLQPSPPIPAPVPVPVSDLPEYDVMGLDASLGFDMPEIPVSFGCRSNLLMDEQLDEAELNTIFDNSNPSLSPTIPSSDGDGSRSPKLPSPTPTQGGWRAYETARQMQGREDQPSQVRYGW